MRIAFAIVGMVLAIGTAHAAHAGAVPAAAEPALYGRYCSACHDHPTGRVPARAALEAHSPEEVIQILSAGVMRAQAANLSPAEIRALAVYLTGRQPVTGSSAPAEENMCAGKTGASSDAASPSAAPSQWNGWGRDSDNSRFQPDPGLAAADVPRLRLKWAFGYRGRSAYGQPVVVGDSLYVTSESGRIYSLDARSGCAHWTFDAKTGSRTAAVVGAPSGTARDRPKVFFGDDSATVYALDSLTGQLVWKMKLDDHPMARITGSPTLYGDRLYVPVSSLEEASAVDPAYECCKFRGSVVALAAATGQVVWRTYVIPELPRPYRKNERGTQLYGPAGGAVWTAPTIDARRRVLYVGTGNSYTDVPAATVDAILALDLDTGRLRWSNQLTPNDNFIVGCLPSKAMCPVGMTCSGAGEGNCPQGLGEDVDFGSSPILRHLGDGRRILIAAQKSGAVYGLDPDKAGKKSWAAQLGSGGSLGGVEWGAAADSTQVYVPISDIVTRQNTPPGSIAALRLEDGGIVWKRAAGAPTCTWGATKCTAAQSQAATAMPGIVFSGSEDGHLRAYSIADGALVWDTDTGHVFQTINGVQGTGGSLDHGGPALANGMLYVNSGYGRVMGQPGNLLLAFSVDGK